MSQLLKEKRRFSKEGNYILMISMRIYPEDIEEVNNIYSLSFDLCHRSQYQKLLENNIEFFKFFWGIKVSNVLSAIHAVVDSQIKIRNKVIDSYYLSYVAVLPQLRGRGLGKQLMLDTIELSKNKDVKILIIDPFKHGFYRNAGFATAIDNFYLEINSELLPNAEKSNLIFVIQGGKLSSYDTFKKYVSMRKIFFNKSLNNEIYLDELFLQAKIYSDEQFYYIDDNTNVGYILFKIRNNELSVLEFNYNCKEVYLQLKEFLLSYKNLIKKLSFETVPSNFNKEDFITDYWSVNGMYKFQHYPVRMIRILDVPFVVNKVIDFSCTTEKIVFQIKDNIIEDNNGLFELSDTGFYKLDSYKEPDVQCDINTFTLLLTGYTTVENLHYSDKLSIRNNLMIEKLDCHFPKQTTFSGGVF